MPRSASLDFHLGHTQETFFATFRERFPTCRLPRRWSGVGAGKGILFFFLFFLIHFPCSGKPGPLSTRGETCSGGNLQRGMKPRRAKRSIIIRTRFLHPWHPSLSPLGLLFFFPPIALAVLQLEKEQLENEGGFISWRVSQRWRWMGEEQGRGNRLNTNHHYEHGLSYLAILFHSIHSHPSIHPPNHPYHPNHQAQPTTSTPYNTPPSIPHQTSPSEIT